MRLSAHEVDRRPLSVFSYRTLMMSLTHFCIGRPTVLRAMREDLSVDVYTSG